MVFTFKDKITVLTDKRLNKPLAKSLFENFCKKSCEVDFKDRDEENVIRYGTGMTTELGDDKEFALLIDEYGFAVYGHDTNGLMRGLMALLMQIRYHCDDGENVYFTANPCNIQSPYKTDRRMLHLCVFPETDKLFLHKVIRLAGVLQYTHVILEFWGTLKYDCLPELAWKEAMTKAEAKEYIDEIRAFGMEPVPMFNMLGHASQSREAYGKHTVLDQNPMLQYYFTPDGWAWNIRNPKTKELLKNVRKELYELFGNGEFIHIGCDEAYIYAKDEEFKALLPQWLSELTSDVISEGRRPLMWMDMLLEKRFSDCTCNASSAKDAEKLFASLAKGTVACDWQYGCTSAPVPTTVYLKEKGLDVVGCSWLDKGNIEAMEETVARNGMFGMMVTTWDSLPKFLRGLFFAAKAWNSVISSELDVGKPSCAVATLLRNVMFEDYGYEDAGFMKGQIEK